MASAHVIEVGNRTAGIVVREHGGFRFFASERPFQALDGALFRTLDQVDQATRAARERLRKTPGRRASPPNPSRAGDFARTAFGPFSLPF
jgi:hypothetical protein